MFEKTLVSTARTIYWVLAGSGAAWLAWMCFAHLSFWLALILFPVAFVLMAMAGAPVVAGISFAGGMLVAGLAAIGRRVTASSRSGA
ncbi:hypothetical protein [Laribacter hongkongensis]|uniref:hypothetical protein n=1 Tax=Laribacter hongkongensis TaxID=168471 RepID=UPI001EFE9843|nr:hypothetical protein [Laribacter hongkongensis]MCG9079477.1 hypothetical protein [Laribacter hongkongensis]